MNESSMKVFISLILLSTFIAVSPLVSVELTDVGYRSLIEDVHNKYGSAGVIIALAKNHQAFEKTTTWHGVTQRLTDRGLSTLIIDFKQFVNRFKVYIEKTNPPLIVIALDTIEALRSFESIAKNLNMSYAVWLIVFSKDAGQDVCKLCHDPRGNSFNLKFGSKMLILCCDSNTIEGWWSIDRNRTKTQELGRFSRRLVDGNLEITWFPHELVHRHRSSMDGRVLRVVALKATNIFEERDGYYYGVFGEILRELAHAMNFTVSEIIWDDDFGDWNRETSNWTGIVGRIHRREADIGVGNFLMNNERLNIIHFTCPIGVGSHQLYFRKLDNAYLPWKAHFKALAVDVWMVIIGLVLITPILITVIKYKRNSYFFPFLCEQYMNVWGIFCQQGLPDFPEETALRILYVSIFMSALVTSSAYSASLIRSIAVSSTSLPFPTMEKFAEDGTYKLIVRNNGLLYNAFKFSNMTLMKKMMSLMKPMNSLPRNFQEGFAQVCSGKVAFYAPDTAVKTVDPLPCEIASLRTRNMENSAMIMPKDSEYIDLVDHHIQQFRYSGILQRLERKYYTKLPRNEVNRPPVHLQEIAPILSLVAIGVLIALIIFIIERYYDPPTKKLRNKKTRTIKGNTRNFNFQRTTRQFPQNTFYLHYPRDFQL